MPPIAEEKLAIYAAISRLPFPQSYRGKIFLAAFLGTNVPLLSLIGYYILGVSTKTRDTLRILTVAIAVTLAGTAATLYALGGLLKPVSLASATLRRYLDGREPPDLPTDFSDQAGTLLADVQFALERLDGAISSLGELASRDHLTDTYNRRAGEERLTEDVARAKREGHGFMLVVIDLDQLKPINDRFGHGAGDACLKHLAMILERNIRAGDWVVRWGGDEFLVGVWSDVEEGSPAHSIVERIREDLRRNPTRLPGGEEIRLTISVGVCRWAEGREVRELFSMADEALHRAKREGRGRVVYCP